MQQQAPVQIQEKGNNIYAITNPATPEQLNLLMDALQKNKIEVVFTTDHFAPNLDEKKYPKLGIIWTIPSKDKTDIYRCENLSDPDPVQVKFYNGNPTAAKQDDAHRRETLKKIWYLSKLQKVLIQGKDEAEVGKILLTFQIVGRWAEKGWADEATIKRELRDADDTTIADAFEIYKTTPHYGKKLSDIVDVDVTGLLTTDFGGYLTTPFQKYADELNAKTDKMETIDTKTEEATFKAARMAKVGEAFVCKYFKVTNKTTNEITYKARISSRALAHSILLAEAALMDPTTWVQRNTIALTDGVAVGALKQFVDGKPGALGFGKTDGAKAILSSCPISDQQLKLEAAATVTTTATVGSQGAAAASGSSFTSTSSASSHTDDADLGSLQRSSTTGAKASSSAAASATAVAAVSLQSPPPPKLNTPPMQQPPQASGEKSGTASPSTAGFNRDGIMTVPTFAGEAATKLKQQQQQLPGTAALIGSPGAVGSGSPLSGAGNSSTTTTTTTTTVTLADGAPPAPGTSPSPTPHQQ